MKQVCSFLLFLTSIFLLADHSHGYPSESKFKIEVAKYLETRTFSTFWYELAEEYDLKNLLLNEHFNTLSWPESKVTAFCAECRAAVNAGVALNDTTAITEISIEFCLNVLHAGNQRVCEGMVSENAPIVYYMFGNYGDTIDAKDLCGFVFASAGCVSDNPARNWNITLPDVPKPPIEPETAYPDPDSVPTYKILHFSDTHIDLYYQPGTNAVCEEEYFCCRNESGTTNITENQAGFWGDYHNCDLPLWTLEHIYDHINKTHNDIDFIIWTGDVIPHNDWETTKESTIFILQEMTDLLLKYFPGIPVYPALGNHDTDIVNQFSQPYITDPEFNMAWLYVPLVEMWSNWLPVSAAESVGYSASYNLLVKPGLRLISVNTNFCQNFDWWLVIDSNDVGQELQRLAETLQSSENFGEKVYIIQHIPSSSCFDVYSHQYNLIISRYEATIVGIFYGHTHNDNMKLFTDPDDDSRIYETAYIGQSQTTYGNKNPGYKIYTVEGAFQGSENRVLDHENWYFPVSVANEGGSQDVLFLYSAKDSYGLPDLSTDSWVNFTLRMNEDIALFNSFYMNQIRNPPNVDPSADCDAGCRHYEICNIYSTDTSGNAPCILDTLH